MKELIYSIYMKNRKKRKEKEDRKKEEISKESKGTKINLTGYMQIILV